MSEARQIGEMARRGAPVKEIVEDHPYIEEHDVEFAEQYVTAHRAAGRANHVTGPSPSPSFPRRSIA